MQERDSAANDIFVEPGADHSCTRTAVRIGLANYKTSESSSLRSPMQAGVVLDKHQFPRGKRELHSG